MVRIDWMYPAATKAYRRQPPTAELRFIYVYSMEQSAHWINEYPYIISSLIAMQRLRKVK